jgi:hypothetical protein
MKRLAIIVILAAFAVPCAWTQSQQQPPTPPAKEKDKAPKRAKRVWTEDDIASVRKPWDEHADKKAAEAAAAAEAEAAKSAPAAEGAAAPAAPAEAPAQPAAGEPKTIEEAQQLIAAKSTEINE